jgi:hypothetical protein
MLAQQVPHVIENIFKKSLKIPKGSEAVIKEEPTMRSKEKW